MGYHWSYTYWVFTVISIMLFLTLALPKYPEAHGGDEKKSDVKFGDLISNPLMQMYTLAIFLYVGVEVGIANNIGLFLEDLYKHLWCTRR